MDGEHYFCPIIEDRAVRVDLSDDVHLIVSACSDSIQMFPDSRYTHLRYYDAKNRAMRMVFLPEDTMIELAEFGIPVQPRESITNREHESWITFMGRCAMLNIDQELDDLLE